MGLINELGGQPYSFIHTSFTAIRNVKMPGGSNTRLAVEHYDFLMCTYYLESSE